MSSDRTVAALAAAAAVLVQIGACGGSPVTPVDDPTAREVATRVPPLELPAMKVSLEELEHRLPRYEGCTAQVTGTIQPLAIRMFTLGDNVSLDSHDDLIVSAPGTLADTLREGTIVSVTGTVKTLALDDLVDPRDWPQECTGIDWTRQPVIVAMAIEWLGTRAAAIMASRGQAGASPWKRALFRTAGGSFQPWRCAP